MNAPGCAAIVSLILSPCFSFMVCEFFQPGMIFSFWGDWIYKEDRDNQLISDKIKTVRCAFGISDDDKREAISVLESQIKNTPFYKKPLGNCLKCFHVWVFGFFLLQIYYLPIEVPIYLSLLGLSYVILVKSFYR